MSHNTSVGSEQEYSLVIVELCTFQLPQATFEGPEANKGQGAMPGLTRE